MQFSDTTNLQGIIQDIDFRCSTDANRYLTNDKVRNINIEYDKVVEFVNRKQRRIKWADTATTAPYNFTDYALTDGEATVTITAPFRVERIEVANEDTPSVWSTVQLIDRAEIPTAVQEFQDTESIPRFATIDGDEITLYPTPNYTKANALRIYDVDQPTLFDAADTTETPVLPRFAIPIVSIGASIAYCNIYKADRVPAMISEYRSLYAQLGDFLADRESGRGRITAHKTLAQ